MGGGGPSHGPSGGPGCVVMVYNLPSAEVKDFNPDHIYNVFGIYGDIHRIRLMSKPADSAMVQFRTAQEASSALHALRNSPLFGKALNVTVSKHEAISGEGLGTKDYENSPLLRYRKGPPSKAPNPPCSTLYFGNASAALDESKIRSLLLASGAASPVAIRFITPKDGSKDASHAKKDGFIDFGSVDAAMKALLLANNQNVEGLTLRLAFANFSNKSTSGGAAGADAAASQGPAVTGGASYGINPTAVVGRTIQQALQETSGGDAPAADQASPENGAEEAE